MFGLAIQEGFVTLLMGLTVALMLFGNRLPSLLGLGKCLHELHPRLLAERPMVNGLPPIPTTPLAPCRNCAGCGAVASDCPNR